MATFAGRIAPSRWWLERFPFGPVEWLRRCLTYGKLEPMRLRVVPEAIAS